MATGGPTIAKAFVAVIPTTKGAQKAITDEMIPAAAAAGEGGGKALSEAMSSTITKGAGKIAAAVAAIGIGKAFVDITKGAVDAYSTMEQLTGGVETIFKEAAPRVEELASTAFKRVQMSANDYMSTATSFSASLIQSLGGDTAAAAELADVAITDMADNANKMGTDISAIQNAYQGFAKQNYSMLDNLKLGYGGTQEEAYRLLVRATELNDEFAQTAQFGMDAKGHLAVGFADMVKAIHIVQDDIGIAGASADEAMWTLEGSFNSLSAAWEDWLSTIGTGDMGPILDATRNVGDTLITWLHNLFPRVVTTLASILRLVPQAIGNLLQDLPGIAQGIWDITIESLANAGFDTTALAGPLSALFDSSIGQAIAGLAGRIGDAFGRVFGDIDVAAAFDDIRSAAEFALGVVGDLINATADAVAGFIDSIDTDTIAGAFQWLRDIAEAILPRIVDAFSLVGRVITDIVWPVLNNLGNFVSDTIWPVLQQIWAALQPALETAVGLLGSIWDAVMSIGNGLVDMIGPEIDVIWTYLEPILSSIFTGIGDIESAALNAWNSIMEVIRPLIDWIGEHVGGLFSTIGQWISDNRETIEAVMSSIGNFVGGIIKGITDTISTAYNLIAEGIQGVSGFIRGIVSGIASGISGLRDTVLSIWIQIAGAASNAWNQIWGGVSAVVGWIRDGFWGLVDGVMGAFQAIGDAIMAPFAGAFEGIRSLWNSTIGGFGFDIPDWVPVVGGSTFRLPYLATGGELLTAGSVVVGERGPEVLSLPAGARVAPLRDGDAMGDTTYQVMVGDVDLSDDDQVRRVTREYLEYLVGIARPVNVI